MASKKLKVYVRKYYLESNRLNLKKHDFVVGGHLDLRIRHNLTLEMMIKQSNSIINGFIGSKNITKHILDVVVLQILRVLWFRHISMAAILDLVNMGENRPRPVCIHAFLIILYLYRALEKRITDLSQSARLAHFFTNSSPTV